MKILGLHLCAILIWANGFTQINDSIIPVVKYQTLPVFVVNDSFKTSRFIEFIKQDSSFYKSFKQLHLLNYSAINDIRMLDKQNVCVASLHSKTQQLRSNNCRTMKSIEEEITGDFFDEQHEYNYYTAKLYASLFFTKGKVCNETNTVQHANINPKEKSGLEKHKDQLKQLFFNPGKQITGIPFMRNKTAIYDESLLKYYNTNFSTETKNGVNCIVFNQKVKPENANRVVVQEMKTWFDEMTMQIVARDYELVTDAGVYDFNVKMEVSMIKIGEYYVPNLIRYVGDWKYVFKKRERGVFTITLFDFNAPIPNPSPER
jgi:hypothetical protein